MGTLVGSIARVKNSTDSHTYEQVSLWCSDLESFRSAPRIGTAHHVLHLIFHSSFNSDWMCLHCCQQCVGLPFLHSLTGICSYLCSELLPFPQGIKWGLTVSIYIFLKPAAIGHLHMIIGYLYFIRWGLPAHCASLLTDREVFFFLIFICLRSLYVLGANPLLDSKDRLSHSVGHLFTCFFLLLYRHFQLCKIQLVNFWHYFLSPFQNPLVYAYVLRLSYISASFSSFNKGFIYLLLIL